MKFKYENDEYELEFSRNRRKKDTVDKGISPSRMTTLRIMKTSPGKLPGEVYREVSSTCSVLDAFNAERGRVAALRMVTPTLSKGFRTVMWNAYINRIVKTEKRS